MKGDFSKDTFDARRHFSSVRLQQGRVITDADWNEQADLTRRRIEVEARDVIGGCGAPEAHAGFALAAGTFALAASAIGDDAWIAGEDGMVLRTLDGGGSWVPLDAGTTAHLRAVRFANANVGWAAGDGGTIVKTTSAGAIWTSQDAGVQVALLGLAATGASTAWAVGEHGTIVRTTDGGATWIPSTVGGGRIYAVHFASATAGWIAGQDGGIWSTIDGGVSWTPRPSGTHAHLRALAFLDAVTGWVAGDAGTILKTTDGGATWTAQASNVAANLRAAAVRNANEIWVAGDAGTLRRTSNGGATWQAVDVGQADTTLRAAAMGTAPHGWVAGDASTLIRLAGSPAPALESLPGVSLSIEPGRFYAKGVLCEVDDRCSFYNQPDRVVVDRLAPGSYLVYLDVWQRHISPLEEPSIREVALGGPDTATRARTVWQVRTLPLGDASPPGWNCLSEIPGWAQLIAKPNARLKARAEPEQVAATLCEIGAAGGFRRVENQLYRVEVHDGGSTPTFKWSRENGSVAFAITGTVESAGNTTVTLASRALDDNLDLVQGGWVEVLDDDAVLEHGAGLLRQFVDRGNDPLEIVLHGVLGATGSRPSRHPLLRRWDHRPAGTASALPIEEGQWIGLEDGVEVFFQPGGTYRPGDYWQIPARTITADVEWPRDEHGKPIPRKPAGIDHRYCRLALIDVGFDGAVQITSDCRELFPPLTELTQLLYMSGDGQDGIPGLQLPQPLRVRVVRGEHPIENAVVRFEVSAGQGHLAGAGPGVPLEVLTQADGVAECQWTLGSDANPTTRHQRVDASLLDATDNPVPGQRLVFCATGTLALEYVSGDGQQAPAGEPLAHPLEVRVANGQQGVPGTLVHFAVTQGGGALVGGTPVAAGADGVATIGWRLGAAGAQRVEAEIRQAGGARVQHIGFNAGIVEPSAASHGGCSITIGPDGEVKELTTDVLKLLLEKFKGSVCFCFMPGAHEINGIDIDAPDKGRLSIHGCGHACVVHLRKPIRMAGFVSVEMSGFTVNVDAGAGFLFEKCREVVVESLTVTANPSAFPVVRIAAADTATIAGCTIVTKVPAAAVVFEDAQAITRFTDNDIRGVVSFYGGPPVVGSKPDLAKLAASLKRTTVKLNAAPGSLFMSRNTLEIVTIGRAKFTELSEFTATQRETLEGLFQTAAITDNAMSASPLFESAALTLVALTLPLVPIGDPLGLFVADTATVTGTVSGRSDFRLAVLTKPNQCSDAANIPPILKTV